MRRLLQAALLAAASAAVAACGIHRSEQAGPQTSRTFPVGAFSSLEVAGPYEVRVHSGAKPGVSVTGPKNILDHMVVEVDGNELQIHAKKNGVFSGNWGSRGKVVVEVTTPTLDGVAIAGSGDIAVDQVKGESFKGAVAGSGSLAIAAIDVQSLKLEIAGSGDINAAGTATQGQYEIAGSGSILAPKVTTQSLKVSIAGSGDVAAHSSGTADVEIIGSGDVTVTGGAKCTIDKMGSGNANCS
ncbi:MAG: head GIN domain-containing protein [Pseudomonadota bacterium]